MGREDKSELWFDFLFVIVVGIIFLCMLPRWERGDEERQVLAAAGYSSVQLKGFSVFGCPDLFGMKFEGKGPTGTHAKGVVCKGILTQSSIRLDG